MNRRERRAAGQKPQTRQLSRGAETPASLYESGLQHLREGRQLDAQRCCQQALAIHGDHADTLHLMGLLSLQVEQHDHAFEWISRAIRQQAKPEYLASLATTLARQGRQEDALKTFDKALQLKPGDASLWHSLGGILADLKRPADALRSFEQALKLDPRNWKAAYRSGLLMHELGRSEEALSYLDRGATLEPNQAVIQEVRAVALHRLNRLDEALAANQKAYALNPKNAATCNNIGAALQLLGRDQEALEWFDQAYRLRPDQPIAVINKASSLQQLHRFDEAITAYRHVKTIDPANPEPDWNLALINLLHENFEAGWAGREARWRRPNPGLYPKFSEPRWFGDENIEGKTILICADEGLGDTIQFARYVPMVAARGARVVLVVEPPAYPLLRSLPGIAQCLRKAAGTAVPDFDLHCPMSALPLVFGTRLNTIPSGVSYLPPLPESQVQAWRQRLEGRLGSNDKLRVGLVWSGNRTHPNDHNRSLRLRVLSRILDVDAVFISLQKDPQPEDHTALRARTDIVELTEYLTDLSETAALVRCLDLVITIDSGVAHLAAALGCPTWILLPYTPDYRWLLDRDDSPWYPTVKLFRQTEIRDYGEVLDRVRTELKELVAARPM